MGPELAAVNAVLSLVVSLKGMPWGKVVRRLEEERKVLVKADARWGGDGKLARRAVGRKGGLARKGQGMMRIWEG